MALQNSAWVFSVRGTKRSQDLKTHLPLGCNLDIVCDLGLQGPCPGSLYLARTCGNRGWLYCPDSEKHGGP